MHQPEYKDHLTGEYRMPWTRLHAVKDYLDMVLLLERYPKIRQTFNLVPSLIDQLIDYTKDDTHDRHSRLLIASSLSDDDKHFILARCFDSSWDRMVSRSDYYRSLLDRRNQVQAAGEPWNLNAFSEQEYFDILAWFNLVWFDPIWLARKPQLKAIWEQGHHFDQPTRQQILDIQRDIIRQILPTYKAFQDNGQIEVTTTPYYHPILPLLIDTDSAKMAMPDAAMPEERFHHPEDAEAQVIKAREQYARLFGHDPVGIWPAEQSISPDALSLIQSECFQWAISSEGNLAKSLGIGLEKDPYGNVLNADVFCRPYQYQGLKLVFRDLTLSDLIGFHYAQLSPEQAATDLIVRLKELQKRAIEQNVAYPIVTIALDGENCWESYAEDGNLFLAALYDKLSAEEAFNVCRVRDYFEAVPDTAVTELHYIHSGSWINSNFHIWIADPVKNAAWTYLKRTRDDLSHLASTGHYQAKVLDDAWREVYIAEGSDWFWWYGEPHNSGQDEVFDEQFRMHLANVYRLLDEPTPDFLDIPLTVTMGQGVIPPSAPITPELTGKKASQPEWQGAGSFDLSHGAMHRGTRILKKVYFGSSDGKAFLRLELNPESLGPFHEILIYACTPGKTRFNSPVRVKAATTNTVQTQRYHYCYEISLSKLHQPSAVHVSCAEAIPDHLWVARSDIKVEAAFGDVLDLALPLEAFHLWPGDYLQFILVLTQGGVAEEVQPSGSMLSLERYHAPVAQETALPTGMRGF